MKPKLLLLAIAMAMSSPASHAADCCAKTPGRSCGTSPAPASAPLPDTSILQLDSKWTRDDGQAFNLASLRGRPVVVAMFFAHCQYACPLLVYKMQQVEAALPDDIRSKVDFLLVTFDTEHDTPTELASYRAQHNLGGHWTLLHGAPGEVQDLAAVLGIKYKKDAQGQFAHSNVLTLLNAQGELAYQEPGLTLGSDEMVRRIVKIVKP